MHFNPTRNDFEACLKARPDCVPGERVTLDGRTHAFDMKLANQWRAWRAVEAAPTDLTGLSYNELKALEVATATVRGFDAWCAVNEPLRARVWAEFTRRGYDSTFRKVA